MFAFQNEIPVVQDDVHVAFCPDCQENKRGLWLLCPNHVHVKVLEALRDERAGLVSFE